MVSGSESLTKKPANSPGSRISVPVRTRKMPVVEWLCRMSRHSGKNSSSSSFFLSSEASSPSRLKSASSRIPSRIPSRTPSCSWMDAHLWFMSFCRITFLFSTSRFIMLTEDSSIIPVTRFITSVPMVIRL